MKPDSLELQMRTEILADILISIWRDPDQRIQLHCVWASDVNKLWDHKFILFEAPKFW
jgi:hypothetical protein